MESAMSDAELAARVDGLERVARRHRLCALGALVLVLATAQAPAVSAPVVVGDATGARTTLTAKGLTVRDAAGRVRTTLGLDADGYPSLDLSDASGRLRESMYLLTDRPVLRLFDTAGKRRAELFLASDTQNGEFVITDAAQVTRLAVFVGAKGLPEMGLYGADNTVRAYFSADDDGSYLVMKDAHGTTRAVAGQYTSGKFGFDVRNAAGSSVWSRP